VFTARYELNIYVQFVLLLILKLLNSFELQQRLYVSPYIAGPYRELAGSREIISGFTPWFEGLKVERSGVRITCDFATLRKIFRRLITQFWREMSVST
jgi:hypothetical protein